MGSAKRSRTGERRGGRLKTAKQRDQPITARIAADGAANLLRFAVTALSVVAVTPVISRVLDAANFSVWTLVVSISTYVALAEAGATSAVTRFVAGDIAREAGEAAGARSLRRPRRPATAPKLSLSFAFSLGRIHPALL